MDKHKVIVEYAATIQPYASAARKLRTEIEALNTSIIKSRAISSETMQGVTRDFNANLQGMKHWSTQSIAMDSAAVRLGKSIERNHLTMARQKNLLKEYRAGAVGARGAISELAKEQVRMSRSQVNFYDDANGARRAQVSTPQGINFRAQATQIAVARQEMQIYNRVLAQNAEATVNWGKNTQWAGRQIMVGMTVPLLMMGAAAKNVFMDVDQELTRMGKVYGGSVGIVSDNVVNNIKEQVKGLGTSLASDWGVSMKDTIGLAADVAATGKEGEDLLISTREAMRLSVLGEVDRQEALKATLSLQSAFKLSNEELVESVNLLNAVENQTSTTLEDLSTAIPKAGPVVQALGGDVGDLATMLVSMKEGGIAAAEGANAIKSGLASLINPTKRAQEASKELGIDLVGIVERNKGQLMPTMLEFQKSLMGLTKFQRAKLIEKIFGKYQFARISALFENLNREGSQSIKAMELNGASAQELATIADVELKRLTDSTSGRWKRAVEGFKAQIVPAGEVITKVFTAVLGSVTKVLSVFNDLPDPIKNIVGAMIGITALVGPLLMIAGIFGNFIGQVMKGFAFLRGKKFGVFNMLTTDMVAANAATGDLVNAQFNEKKSLLEINTVMERQIALLKDLAAQHTNAAGAMNAAAAGMPMAPPPVPGAGGRRADELAVDSQTTQNINTTSLGSRFLLDNPEAAKKWKEQSTGVQAELYKSITPEAVRSANVVGPAVGMFLDDQLNRSGVLNADELYGHLMQQFPPGTENHEMAKKAAATVYHQLGVEKIPAELQKMIDKVPQGKRQGAGSMFRGIWAAAAGEGATAPAHKGNIHSGHIIPDSWDPGDLGPDGQPTKAAKNAKMTSLLGQMPQVAEENTLLGDSGKMSNKDIVRGWSLFGAQTATQSHVLMDADPKVVQGAASAKRTASTGSLTTEAFANSEYSREFEAWKSQVGSGRVNIMALRESLEKLVATSTEATAAALGLSDADRQATAERAGSAAIQAQADLEVVQQEQIAAAERAKQAKARTREVMVSGQETIKQAKATAASQRSVAQSSMRELAQISIRASSNARTAIQTALNGPFTAKGIQDALTAVNSRIATLDGRDSLTSPQTAELAALKAAAERLTSAANALTAAEKAGDEVGAARIEMQAAQTELEAANREAGAANVAAGAAERLVVAAASITQAAQMGMVGAAEEMESALSEAHSAAIEENAAREIKQAAMILRGSGERGFIKDPAQAYQMALDEDALRKPAKGQRMAGFMNKTGAGTMGAGIGLMGAGALMKNENVTAAGGMLSSVSMVAMAAESLAGPLGKVASRMKSFVGGIGKGATLAMRFTSIMSRVVLGVGRIASLFNPVSLAITAAAGIAFLAWKAWKTAKDRQDADKHKGEVHTTGIEVKTADRFIKKPGAVRTDVDQKAFEDKVKTNEGYKGLEKNVSSQANDGLKIAYMETQYDSALKQIEQVYGNAKTEAEKKTYATKVQDQKDLFEVLAKEKDLTNQWRDAKKQTLEERIAAYGAAKKLKEEQDKENPNDPNSGFYTPPKREFDPEHPLGMAGAGPMVDLPGMFKFDALPGQAKEIAQDAAAQFATAFNTEIGDGSVQTQLGAALKTAMALGAGEDVDFGAFKERLIQQLGEGTRPFLQDATDMNDLMNRIATSSEAIPESIMIKFGIDGAAEIQAYFDLVKSMGASIDGSVSAMTKRINDLPDKAVKSEEELGKAYDKNIESMERAAEMADRAHKAEADASKERQDAIKEKIDGVQKEIDGYEKAIDKINEQADAQHKLLDRAKDLADFQRGQRQSEVEYYDAIARGDFVGAAGIRSNMEQESSDQQTKQAGDSIDDKAKAKVDAQQAKIDKANTKIEAYNNQIDAIEKAQQARDKAFEKQQTQTKDRIDSIRNERDTYVKAEAARQKAAAEAERVMRTEAAQTYSDKMNHIKKLVTEGKLTVSQAEADSKAAAKAVSKALGWTPEQANNYAKKQVTALMNIYHDSLTKLGLEGKELDKYSDMKWTKDKAGNWNAVDIVQPPRATTYGRGTRGSNIPSASHQGDYISTDHTTGLGGNKSDEVTRTLQVGEYVVRKEAVKKYGRDNIHAINKMQHPKMHTGGPVGPAAMGMHGANVVASKMGDIFQASLAKKVINAKVAAIQAKRASEATNAYATGGPAGGLDVGDYKPVGKTEKAQAFLNAALGAIGTPYSWGGGGSKGPTLGIQQGAETVGFDCSGLVYFASEMAKIANGGRQTAQGYRSYTPGGKGEVGDLVTYQPPGGVAHHIGIAAGKGMMINAPHTGARVRYDNIARFGSGDTVEYHRFPGMKKGGRVKFDNTIANLHKGESVLTARLSSSLMEGIEGFGRAPAIMGSNVSGGGTTINEGERSVSMNIYGAPGQDVSDLANIIAEREARAEARMGNR